MWRPTVEDLSSERKLSNEIGNFIKCRIVRPRQRPLFSNCARCRCDGRPLGLRPLLGIPAVVQERLELLCFVGCHYFGRVECDEPAAELAQTDVSQKTNYVPPPGPVGALEPGQKITISLSNEPAVYLLFDRWGRRSRVLDVARADLPPRKFELLPVSWTSV
jgi:hypothetical protein